MAADVTLLGVSPFTCNKLYEVGLRTVRNHHALRLTCRTRGINHIGKPIGGSVVDSGKTAVHTVFRQKVIDEQDILGTELSLGILLVEDWMASDKHLTL